jgi:hypothetical protein
MILAAAVVVGRLTLPASADEWKEIPLDSCRKVQGLSEKMMGLSLDGKTLYAIGGGTLYALDVSEPANPKWLGSLDGMGNNRQIAVSDGIAYVVSRETGMRIVDVSDPKNMKLRSLYDSVEFATGIDVVGKTAFLSERIYGVEAVDVSNPDRPRHIAIRITPAASRSRRRATSVKRSRREARATAYACSKTAISTPSEGNTSSSRRTGRGRSCASFRLMSRVGAIRGFRVRTVGLWP